MTDRVRRLPVRAARLTWLLTALTTLLMVVLPAGPASAHSELVSSTPADGAVLAHAPREVRMDFTEGISLVDGGLTLLDADGAAVRTPTPTAAGRTITWPMPPQLPDGTYLVNWRVVSADGHPVAGAFAFGVGAVTRPVAVSGASPATTAPSPVVLVRWAGYVAFALVVGVILFVTWCAPGSRHPVLQVLARVGLVGGVLTTTAGVLVQGPYATGAGWGAVLDPDLLAQTVASPFGTVLLWRIGFYAALSFGVFVLTRLEATLTRWLVADGVVAVAVTFALAGHGTASGRSFDLVVDTVHVLAASAWVGGLIVLVALGRSVERRALQQFSRLAALSVLALLASGVLNSVLRLHSVLQLVDTRYGLVLLAKVLLVVVALLAAAVTRSRLHGGSSLTPPLRVEAAVTVVVLAVTAVLTLTTPPPSTATPAGAPGHGDDHSAAAPAVPVELPLGDGRIALLTVSPTAGGSSIRVGVLDVHGELVGSRRVALRVSLPARGIDNLDVPLTRQDKVWKGRYRFPLPGDWTLTLTVADRAPTAVVTSGHVDIRR
jgi:copper transport protein